MHAAELGRIGGDSGSAGAEIRERAIGGPKQDVLKVAGNVRLNGNGVIGRLRESARLALDRADGELQFCSSGDAWACPLAQGLPGCVILQRDANGPCRRTGIVEPEKRLRAWLRR